MDRCGVLSKFFKEKNIDKSKIPKWAKLIDKITSTIEKVQLTSEDYLFLFNFMNNYLINSCSKSIVSSFFPEIKTENYTQVGFDVFFNYLITNYKTEELNMYSLLLVHLIPSILLSFMSVGKISKLQLAMLVMYNKFEKQFIQPELEKEEPKIVKEEEDEKKKIFNDDVSFRSFSYNNEPNFLNCLKSPKDEKILYESLLRQLSNAVSVAEKVYKDFPFVEIYSKEVEVLKVLILNGLPFRKALSGMRLNIPRKRIFKNFEPKNKEDFNKFLDDLLVLDYKVEEKGTTNTASSGELDVEEEEQIEIKLLLNTFCMMEIGKILKLIHLQLLGFVSFYKNKDDKEKKKLDGIFVNILEVLVGIYMRSHYEQNEGLILYIENLLEYLF